jgi:hypothetical protein
LAFLVNFHRRFAELVFEKTEKWADVIQFDCLLLPAADTRVGIPLARPTARCELPVHYDSPNVQTWHASLRLV